MDTYLAGHIADTMEIHEGHNVDIVGQRGRE